MSEITQEEALRRLRSVTPRWFGLDATPVADGLQSGFAALGAWLSAFLAQARRQTRIATAEAGFLDLIAFDFFGRRFMRRARQTDAQFRQAILDEVFRERATRRAVIRAVEDLTGRPVWFFEPANPADTGGIGVATSMGYSMAGRWGSLAMPYQALCIPLRPAGSAIPNVNGFSGYLGGYGVGAMQWSSLAFVRGEVTDADIYAMIAGTQAAGTIVWTSIQSGPLENFLDLDFMLDQSLLAPPR